MPVPNLGCKEAYTFSGASFLDMVPALWDLCVIQTRYQIYHFKLKVLGCYKVCVLVKLCKCKFCKLTSAFETLVLYYV